MAFALFKLSYNAAGDSSLTGGICGTGFFVDLSTAVTAHHVLNEATFAPNSGFKHARLWVITRSGQVHHLERSSVHFHPEIDTTLIRFRVPILGVHVYRFATRAVSAGLAVRGIGHVGDAMPSIDPRWEGAELKIKSVNLDQTILDRDGQIKRLLTLDVRANDVKMQGVHGFELSFGSRVGMSGGPVVNVDNGEVLGCLSIGLPADFHEKTETFAVAIDEIARRLFPDYT
jgi:hypothetical protein